MKPNRSHSFPPSPTRLVKFLAASCLAAACGASSLFAASQTWTNAPVSTSWTNVLNWVAKAVPGNINQTANNTGSGDVATFNSPIPLSGIGGASSPIAPDDATNGGRSRGVSGITFDTTNCGAYFIASLTPPVLNSNGVLWVSHNGTIQMTAPVTNNQTILIPLNVFLPSSTDGKYTLMNNSTNPTAALIVSSLSWAQTGGRSVNYVLDGTSTANNVVTNLSNSTSTGAGGITKQGSGTWIIAGPGTQAAAKAININAGKLVVQDPGAFGLASTATVNSNGVVQINAVSLTTSTLALQRSGTVRMNGVGTVNGITVGTAAGTTPTVATTSASDVLTLGNAGNKVTAGLAGNSVLHTAGPGNIQLPFANNYVGNWSVDAGRLDEFVAAALGTGANLNIAAGAIFSVTNLVATTYTLDTAAISANGTGTGVGSTAATIAADAGSIVDLATGSKGISLTITPTAFLGDSTHPALYVSQGTLSLGGNAFSINNAGASALGVGTYKLIQQASGSITSGGGYSVVGVTGNGLVAGLVASIVVTGSEVDLVVAPYTPKNLVWSGTGSAWDIASTSDWLNGALASVFNNSDNVTFNGVGVANPVVALAGTLSPGSVLVSNASPYTFNGGQIAGGASLVKAGSSSLLLNEVNTYSGGTVVSNGTLQLGINNAISGTGAGDVAVTGTGVIDLNNNSATINALTGNGTVDVVSGGGASTLSIGNNNNSGVFSGVLKNTTGTLALTKAGSGTETLSGNNTYSGATTINLGTLKATSLNALGSGNSAVTMAGGILDLASSAVVSSIAGTLGTIANNSNTSTNKLTIQTTSTYSATIADGTGGGGVSVLVNGGTLSLTAGNSYSGGTVVAAGAGLIIGNAGSAGAGGIVASNATRVGFSNTGNPAAFAANNLTTADNSTALVTGGGNQANNVAFQFYGSATATNILTQSCSIGGASTFANFFGTVIISNTSARWFNANGGGDNTTFVFSDQGGGMFSRDNNTIRLGALQGGTPTAGIGNVSFASAATYIIGAKGLSTVFSGVINGTNNIVKTGAGSLTLNGVVITTNTDSATYTNYLYAPTIAYNGNTTVSNGTLTLVVPNSLTNSVNINLAGGTLDATKMGYVSNELDISLTVTNQLLVTDGKLEIYSTTSFGNVQTLGGVGSILATSVTTDSGTIINPGLPTGVLSVNNGITINGSTVNFNLNNTNSPTCSEISAGGAIVLSGANLVVTNTGGDLITGDVYPLFNKAVTGTFTLSLPAQNAAATITYVYQTNLVAAGSSPAGTIKVLAGASAIANYSTNITATVSGSTLTVAWPSTHLGWELAIQTNSIQTGLSGNWVTNFGTASVTSTNFAIDTKNGSVFYRLVHP